MADYLTSLVKRTMGVTPVVAPVIKPLFAQGPAIHSAGVMSDFESVSAEETAARTAADSRETLPRPRSAMSLPRTEDSGLVQAQAIVPVPPSPQAQPAPGEAQPLLAVPASAPVAPLSQPFLRVQAGEDRNDAAIRPKVEARGGTPEDLQGDKAVPRQTSHDAEHHRSGEPERPALAREYRREDLTGPQPRATVASSVPPVAESLRPKARARAESEAIDQPPVIRVTIGRVEVRANVPPAKPATRGTPPRKSAVLPLDEYLKQRSAGS